MVVTSEARFFQDSPMGVKNQALSSLIIHEEKTKEITIKKAVW